MSEHIIPLRRGFVKTPRHKRAKKAVTILREYLNRHLKADSIKIGQHLNEHVWGRGMRNPPGKVAVTAEIKDIDGQKVAHVELQGKKFKESVRPEERQEQEGGLKGKLQELTQGKDKTSEKEAVSESTPEAPVKTAKKTTAKPEVDKENPTVAKQPVKKAGVKKTTKK